MAKKFSELRANMSPDAQACAAEQAMLKALHPQSSSERPDAEIKLNGLESAH